MISDLPDRAASRTHLEVAKRESRVVLVTGNVSLDGIEVLAVRLDDLRNVEGDRALDRLSERARSD